MATRSENMKRIKKNQKEETRKKILMLITGMFKEDYKLNGKWNKSKISRDLKIDLTTTKRHFKEIEKENIISQ